MRRALQNEMSRKALVRLPKLGHGKLCHPCEIVDLGQCRRVYELRFLLGNHRYEVCHEILRVRDRDRGIRRRAGKGLTGAGGLLFAIMASHPIGLAEARKETW